MRATLLPPALVAFVFLSSYFGLGSTYAFYDPLQVIPFMGEVWTSSVLADLVFVAGTIGAALVAYRTALRSRAGGLALGALLHWATYLLSFMLLPQREGMPLGEAIPFVLQWGWPGLAFAAIAPAVVAHLDLRADSPAETAPPAAANAKP